MTSKTHSLEFDVRSFPPFSWLWVSLWAYFHQGYVVFHVTVTIKSTRFWPNPKKIFDDRLVISSGVARDLARLLCRVSGLHEPNFDREGMRKLREADK